MLSLEDRLTKGTLSFAEFLLRFEADRTSFGPKVLGGGPLGVRITKYRASTAHDRRSLVKAEKKLARIKRLSPAAQLRWAAAQSSAVYRREKAEYEKELKCCRLLSQRYKRLRAQAEAWEVRTTGYLVDVKLNLLEHIKSRLRRFSPAGCKPPKRLTAKQFLKAEIKDLEQEISRSRGNINEERSRAVDENKWWDALIASLPSPKRKRKRPRK